MPGDCVVYTVDNRCRSCYSCIRSCPVKAIRVSDGQARIMAELCINCGVCLSHCSQGAKQVLSWVPQVRELVATGEAVAVLDPFWPVAVHPAGEDFFFHLLRQLGFAAVLPLAGGTALLQPAYDRFLAAHAGPVISSYCPVVVNLVERYFSSLIEHLAPAPSLAAAGTALARRRHPGRKVVFLTPCLAAREEAGTPGGPEAVVTFGEIKTMLFERRLTPSPDSLVAGPAPPVHPDVFPAGQTVFAGSKPGGVTEDVTLAAQGPEACLRALGLLAQGVLRPRFADLLFCSGGCLAGPEMGSGLDIYSRYYLMYGRPGAGERPQEVPPLPDRSYRDRQVHPAPVDDNDLERVLRCTNKEKPEDELNCGACGYNTCREKAAAVCRGMAEVSICLPYLLDQFRGEAEFYRKKSRLDDELRKLIVGDSPVMAGVRQLAVKMAQNEATLLIEGESGVGKEVFARAVHQLSGRPGGFVGINCAALPENLLESELFGYEGGAFTGARRQGKPGKLELAGEGTILLDEIGDLDPVLQAKLLRVLQERQFERVGGTRPVRLAARIMAASNRSLKDLVEEGRFRADLFYRLSVVTVRLPSLKEHMEDIPVLVEHFLHLLGKHTQSVPKFFSQKALETLARYHWPGNVRELNNVVEQTVYTCEEHVIQAGHLPEYIRRPGKGQPVQLRPLNLAVRQLEKDLIAQALQKTANNRLEAARLLGVPRATFYLKLKEYGF